MKKINSAAKLRERDPVGYLAKRRNAVRLVLRGLDKDASKRCASVPRRNRADPNCKDMPLYWHLAQELAVSVHTVLHWIRRGNVPKSMAMNITSRYGLIKKLKDLHSE